MFEGRYKATIIDAEHYLLSCYRYMDLNLVRAAMVSHLSEYPWSSYAVNALGVEDAVGLLVPHSVYASLDRNPDKRHASYRALFRTRVSDKAMEEIRESTNKSWVLGSDKFKAQIERRTGLATLPRTRGGDRKSKVYLSKINGVRPH